MLWSVEVTCKHCGSFYVINVPYDGYRKWATGQARIQDALPMLTDDERELLLSRTCPYCWDKITR